MELKGQVKYTKSGELVAEVSVNDTAFLAVGKSSVTVDGVTATVKRIGDRFRKGSIWRQYVYLMDATGDVPPQTDVPESPATTVTREDGFAPNRYAGACCDCGQTVGAGKGVLVELGTGGWGCCCTLCHESRKEQVQA